MTDTRQVLEEAWAKIVGPVDEGDEWTMPSDPIAFDRRATFTGFLDAEAWTDAALCLVPEGWAWMVRDDGLAVTLRKKGNEDGCYSSLDGFTERAKTPALAIAQAALRAQEAGDV